MLHDGKPRDLSELPPERIGSLYEHVVKVVVETIPSSVVEKCQCDVHDMIRRCAKGILNLPSGEPFSPIMLIAGKTQSGKSNLEAIFQATVCDVLKCPLIIITKGVTESKDLAKKIWDLLNEGKTGYDAFVAATSPNQALIRVHADTASRIKKVIQFIKEWRKLKPHGKFAVLVDECDAMYRTEGGIQQFEIAYQQLMDMRPALRVEITATPIPALLALGVQQGHEIQMVELGTSEDYSGVSEMTPLLDNDGEAIYLDSTLKPTGGVLYQHKKNSIRKVHDGKLLFPHEGDLNDKRTTESESRSFESCKRHKHIPCTNEDVMSLYDDALALADDGKIQKKGTLVLDITDSLVYTHGNNIFQKAACVQNHFFCQGKEIVIVVVVGNGIHIRRPGYLHGRHVLNRKTASEVLEQLDAELGLEVLIFVFGYSKMKRCISYRSDQRVPTHMVLSLGPGQSNENYIQALGRGTFNGQSVLEENGYTHVTVLCTESDLKMARKYPNFAHELMTRLKDGASVKKVLTDIKKKFPDEANYLRHTNRKTGQNKNLKTYMPTQDDFEEPNDVECFTKDDTSQRILLALRDLIQNAITDADEEMQDPDKQKTEINRGGFAVKEILSQYNSTYQDNYHTLKTGVLSKELTKLKNQAKLEKVDNSRPPRWRAKNISVLEKECKKYSLEHCSQEEAA